MRMSAATSMAMAVALSCGDKPEINEKDPKNLIGTWWARCLLNPNVVSGVRDVDITDTFTATTRTRTLHYQGIRNDPANTDFTCPYGTERQAYFDTAVSDYVVGEDAGTGLEITFTQRSFERAFTSQREVNRANQASCFGYTDWVVTIPKDITGRAPGSRLFPSLCCAETQTAPGNGASTFTIYQTTFTETSPITGDGDWSLQYGMASGTHDGSSEEQRHTTLSDVVLAKSFSG